jgi:RNA polymerase sigma factor for flagellar operon FliA
VPPPQDSPEVLARFEEQLSLVRIIARQVVRELGRTVELEEMEAAGRLGLLEAARRFDPERGVPFKRFANYRVRGAMIDAVRKSGPLPRRAWERLRALEASAEVGAAVSEDAGAAPGAGLRPAEAEQKLTEHLSDLATAMAVGLVAASAYGEQGERVAVDDDVSPEERVERAELRRLVVAAIDELPDQERELVRRHYLEGERFDHVSASLGLSKSWGSRLHTRAIARLTQKLRPMG